MIELKKAESYLDEQFFKDYPERIIKCNNCKKKFTTRFDAKYCSDKCASEFLGLRRVNGQDQLIKIGRVDYSKNNVCTICFIKYNKSVYRCSKCNQITRKSAR